MLGLLLVLIALAMAAMLFVAVISLLAGAVKFTVHMALLPLKLLLLPILLVVVVIKLAVIVAVLATLFAVLLPLLILATLVAVPVLVISAIA
ncbi:MAG: hypothetical protein JWN02_110 [Acidobacteria bacterium]|nr:hypothetical protein [Acidobacteriota bacterium]